MHTDGPQRSHPCGRPRNAQSYLQTSRLFEFGSRWVGLAPPIEAFEPLASRNRPDRFRVSMRRNELANIDEISWPTRDSQRLALRRHESFLLSGRLDFRDGLKQDNVEFSTVLMKEELDRRKTG